MGPYMHVYTFHCNQGVEREEQTDIAKVWTLIAHRGRVAPSLFLKSKRSLLVGLNQLVPHQGKGFESHSTTVPQAEQIKRSGEER